MADFCGWIFYSVVLIFACCSLVFCPPSKVPRVCRVHSCLNDCLFNQRSIFCNPDCPNACVNETCWVFGASCRLGGCYNAEFYKETNCRPCPEGFYGVLCNTSCETCVGSCDRLSGQCKLGCGSGFYGSDCRSRCDPGCGADCDRETGYCLACVPGRFGSACERKCPQNCREKSCFPVNGTCVSCRQGYKGTLCNETCPKGSHGDRCLDTCSDQCLEKDCDIITGHCVRGCVVGYFGPTCESPCPQGFYGDQCFSQCPDTCLQGTACHHVDGHCTEGCSAGYWGDYCESPCPTGSYGDGCRENCSQNCFSGQCNPFTGHCRACKRGKEGYFCQLSISTIVAEETEEGTNLGAETVEEVMAVVFGLFGLGVGMWVVTGLMIHVRRKVDSGKWSKSTPLTRRSSPTLSQRARAISFPETRGASPADSRRSRRDFKTRRARRSMKSFWLKRGKLRREKAAARQYRKEESPTRSLVEDNQVETLQSGEIDSSSWRDLSPEWRTSTQIPVETSCELTEATEEKAVMPYDFPEYDREDSYAGEEVFGSLEQNFPGHENELGYDQEARFFTQKWTEDYQVEDYRYPEGLPAEIGGFQQEYPYYQREESYPGEVGSLTQEEALLLKQAKEFAGGRVEPRRAKKVVVQPPTQVKQRERILRPTAPQKPPEKIMYATTTKEIISQELPGWRKGYNRITSAIKIATSTFRRKPENETPVVTSAAAATAPTEWDEAGEDRDVPRNMSLQFIMTRLETWRESEGQGQVRLPEVNAEAGRKMDVVTSAYSSDRETRQTASPVVTPGQISTSAEKTDATSGHRRSQARKVRGQRVLSGHKMIRSQKARDDGREARSSSRKTKYPSERHSKGDSRLEVKGADKELSYTHSGQSYLHHAEFSSSSFLATGRSSTISTSDRFDTETSTIPTTIDTSVASEESSEPDTATTSVTHTDSPSSSEVTESSVTTGQSTTQESRRSSLPSSSSQIKDEYDPEKEGTQTSNKKSLQNKYKSFSTLGRLLRKFRHGAEVEEVNESTKRAKKKKEKMKTKSSNYELSSVESEGIQAATLDIFHRAVKRHQAPMTSSPYQQTTTSTSQETRSQTESSTGSSRFASASQTTEITRSEETSSNTPESSSFSTGLTSS